MFCASVVYPADSEGFGIAYFRDEHAPLFARLLGSNCIRYEVHEPLRTPGAPEPSFVAAAYFWVTSPEAFGSALREHGAEIYADIANFSRSQPQRGWSRVVGG